MEMRTWRLCKLLTAYVPDVAPEPQMKVSLYRKISFTAISLGCLLFLSHLPLLGITPTMSSDSLRWMKLVMASTDNTFMDMGLSPIMTSGILLQFLVHGKYIVMDRTIPEDRVIFRKIEALLSYVITIGQGTASVLSGKYGENIGPVWGCLVVVQLLCTTVAILTLDDAAQRGFGLGSISSIFVATNVCENVLWKIVSPMTLNVGKGPEFEGILIEFVRRSFHEQNVWTAFIYMCARKSLHNVLNLCSTWFLFLCIVYFEGCRVNIPIRHKQRKHSASSFPIKLFYASNMPIMLFSALSSNIMFISTLLYSKFPNNIMIQWLGVWESLPSHGSSPVSGLAFYLSPPRGDAILPYITYSIYMMATCAAFALSWIDISGSSAKEVAKQLKDDNIVILGHRDEKTRQTLEPYIFMASVSGAVLMASLSIFADITGTIGSGTGMLLAVTTLYQTYEAILKEAAHKRPRLMS